MVENSHPTSKGSDLSAAMMSTFLQEVKRQLENTRFDVNPHLSCSQQSVYPDLWMKNKYFWVRKVGSWCNENMGEERNWQVMTETMKIAIIILSNAIQA